MFLCCSRKAFRLDHEFLERFVASCHWNYFRKYDLLGHHNLGWGVAYLSEHQRDLKVIRDLTPIYKADWKGLERIKTRFMVVHARKSFPWKKSREDIHPIDVGENYMMTHNGTIKADSFPNLINQDLERMKRETGLDTRKYLCSVLESIKNHQDVKTAFERVLKNIEIGIAANCFLFNAKECHVVNHHHSKFNGRHRTLFLSKGSGIITISTTPIYSGAMEIENNALISIDVSNCSMKFEHLTLNQ